ncbi:phage integrase family protein [Burkholderia ubonensis]|uniref:phage integrase family protein n=1 Tax=Burkholderia ubonensis TaxID=101571 RepID=UPI000ADE8CCC|nr:phage integrase family protein [Burkholderia ubonensis]
MSDPVDVWLSSRAVAALHQHGIRTLAELTVRIPRRRRWWLTIPGLGVRSARQIEAFFAAYPVLTEGARAPIVVPTSEPVVSWEIIRVPHEVDGSRGTFRA